MDECHPGWRWARAMGDRGLMYEDLEHTRPLLNLHSWAWATEAVLDSRAGGDERK
jgi:hypothetical protein